MANKVGAPIEWTPEKKEVCIDVVLTLMAEEGRSLSDILRNEEDMPAMKTWYEWIKEDKDLSNNYARACEIRAELIFDEMFKIADNTVRDYIEDEDGNEIVNHEVINRSRLRIDTRKWALSKMMPKKYGDKIDVTSNGETVNIPVIEWVKNKDE